MASYYLLIHIYYSALLTLFFSHFRVCCSLRVHFVRCHVSYVSLFVRNVCLEQSIRLWFRVYFVCFFLFIHLPSISFYYILFVSFLFSVDFNFILILYAHFILVFYFSCFALVSASMHMHAYIAHAVDEIACCVRRNRKENKENKNDCLVIY